MKNLLAKAGIALSLMLLSLGAQALPQAYDISWDGNRGYSLAGMFSYSPSDSRYVNSGDLTNFMMEGFHRGNSIGVFTGTPDLFKKIRVSSLLQSWNVDGKGLNFGCILSLCAIGVDGEMIRRSKTFFTHLDVTPKTIEGGGGQGLSAPTGILALLAGLAAFAFRRRAAR